MTLDYPETEIVETPAGPQIPHSRDAEEAVIGGILINPDVYYDVAYKLRTDDFYIHRHRFIWDAFRRLHEARTPIDIMTLSEELDRFGQLSEVGGPAYLTALIGQVPTSMHVINYAEIVINHSIRRKAITGANVIAQAAYNEENTPDELIDTMMKESIKLANHSNGDKRLVTMRQAAEEEYDRLDRVSKEGQPEGVKTGYIDIDSIIKSMAPGELVTIAGRTGMGKTSFLESVVYNNISAADPKRVLVAQVTDINRDTWMQRLMAMETEIDSNRIKTASLSEEEVPEYIKAIGKVGAYPCMIDDTPNMSVEKLLSTARRAQSVLHGLDLIVVDYIQKMGIPRDMVKYMNRVNQIDHITSGLKFIARELNVPVMAAAQLSRSVEMRADARPKLSDLRESGALEQDSQIVMFIFREDQYKPDTTKINIAEIIVAKNTNGNLGSAELTWRGAFTRFENAARY